MDPELFQIYKYYSQESQRREQTIESTLPIPKETSVADQEIEPNYSTANIATIEQNNEKFAELENNTKRFIDEKLMENGILLHRTYKIVKVHQLKRPEQLDNQQQQSQEKNQLNN